MKFTKETIRRAMRTFLQAFFGSLVGTIALIDTSDNDALTKSIIFVVIVPSVACGLSALMNMEQKEDTIQ